MHAASNQGHVDVVKLLASLRASVKAVDLQGRQPMHVAGHTEVVELLAGHGASFAAADRRRVRLALTPGHAFGSVLAASARHGAQILSESGNESSSMLQTGVCMFLVFVSVKMFL